MADARSERAKHAHEANALSYGHVGTATYDDQTHEWTFLRQSTTPKFADPDEETAALQSSPHFELVHENLWRDRDHVGKDTAAPWDTTIAHGESSSALTKEIPEIAIASTTLTTSALVPHGRELSPDLAPIGDVLTVGSFSIPVDPRAPQSLPSRSVVAFAAGPGGEALRLVALEAAQVAIRSETDVARPCRLACLGDHITGRWCGSTEPILHISCLSSPKRTRIFLLQRSGTTVLQPMVAAGASRTESPSAAGQSSHASRAHIDPRPIVRIPASRTGGQPHAHNASHPEDPDLVAIVNTHGQWSVWKLTGNPSTSAHVLFKARLQGSGELRSAIQKPPSEDGDEWHRVCWLRSPRGQIDRLLVCNRHFAAVFEQGGKYLGKVDMRLGQHFDRSVILDIKSGNTRSDLILVLTTSRLLVFASTQDPRRARKVIEPLELACSWNHFRDRTDLSLRMSLMEYSQGVWILLYSATSNFAIIYHFGYGPSGFDVVSLDDPSIFTMPEGFRGDMQAVTDILMIPVEFQVGNTSVDMPNTNGFVKLLALKANGQIVEALYTHALDLLAAQKTGVGSQLVLPMPRASHARSRSANFEEMGDFVVADEVESEPSASDTESVELSQFSSVPLGPLVRDWQTVLQDPALQHSQFGVSSFGDSLRRVTEQFHNGRKEATSNSFQLLSDILHNYQISDVEDDSEIANQCLGLLNSQGDISIASEPIRQGYLAGLPWESLIDIYNHLNDSFVTSLSARASDRSRVNRERLVRQVAADAFVAALVLKDTMAPGESEVIKQDSLLMPEEHQDKGSSMPSTSEDLEGLSSTANSQSKPTAEEPIVGRLRRYAAFRHVVPPLLNSHNEDVSNTLAHIPVDIARDPAEYSYLRTNQQLKQEQDERATQSLDPRSRQKALRQAARLQRRLAKTAQMTQEIAAEQNLLPTITSSRGAGVHLPGREVQSSQVGGPESSQGGASQSQGGVPGLNMTQPERGAFGTRLATTGKKGKEKTKKRIPGFG